MLNIKFKDLKCQTFFVAIDETLTVKHLKEKLAEERKLDYSPEKQLLIYGGKVLQDDSILTTLDINTEKFVVLMKQRPVKKIADDSSESDIVSCERGDCVKKKPQVTVKPRSTRYSGASLEKKKDKSTSVKEIVQRSSLDTLDINHNSTMSDDAMLAIGSNNDFLRIRSMVERDPAKLNIILDHIARTNPSLYEMISQNREHFLELLGANLGIDKDDEVKGNPSGRSVVRRETASVQVQAGHGMHPRSAATVMRLRSPLRGGADEPTPSRSMRLPSRILTTSEKEAIERLKAMGFEENLVIQAYFACEKDENAAANFLLQQHDD